MSVAWLAPAAFWGLALIAVPIAIHLLVREHTRTVAYPSLRFVRQTALAALRRRTIQDAALLVCRAAIIAAAVTALAAPVMQTAWRSASYAQRTSRAVVRLDASAAASAAEQQRDAFRSAIFQRDTITDAVNESVRWLDAQPPASRELIFVGGFHRGQVAQSDLIAIPETMGVRFVRAPSPSRPHELLQPVLTRRNGKMMRVNQHVALDTDATRVSAGDAIEIGDDRLRVIAAPGDQPLADAALRAALDAGVRWTLDDRRVVVVWDGAEGVPPASADLQIIHMPIPVPPSSSASAIWNALDAAIPSDAVEPVPIPEEVLTEWSRPAGPSVPDASPHDEGDRRWLWVLALLLIGIEQLLRRERQSAAEPLEERRVA